jgi:undecaprenyl-phosphate 4-deoxy-4-formamido-L-arabinose transferase
MRFVPLEGDDGVGWTFTRAAATDEQKCARLRGTTMTVGGPSQPGAAGERAFDSLARACVGQKPAMSDLRPGISVVVPVYNSAELLPQLGARLNAVLSARGEPYEIIFVNDGSRDGSWATVQDLAARDSHVRGFCMMRNYGQHNAVLAGVRQARFATTVTMDDDLQHVPEEVPKLLAKLTEGFDVVYGTPQKETHGFLRDVASVITKLALRSAMGPGPARVVSSWRAFRTHLRDAFAAYRSPFVSIDVLLIWGTTKFGSVSVRHEERTVGKSNYTFSKLVRHALNMMTGFSVLPLQFASIIGFVFTLFGVGVLLYVLITYFVHGGSVAGFPFLASVIAIFSGAQLFALGIIGEYLARMHFRTMDKPTYSLVATTDQVGAGPGAASP